MNNRTFTAMSEVVKKRAANAPAITAQELGFAAMITRSEERMTERFDLKAAHMAQATHQQGPAQTQSHGGNRKRKGADSSDNRPSAKSGNKKSDAPATRNETSRTQALRDGPCPLHPTWKHSAKNCRDLRAAMKDN
jgi:hypothetical protein